MTAKPFNACKRLAFGRADEGWLVEGTAPEGMFGLAGR